MSDRLSRCFKQVILAQLLILGVSFAVGLIFFGLNDGIAVALGASLALINTLLSKRSIQRSSALAYQKPDMSMLPIFSGLIQRLIVFAAGFASGVVLFSLAALPILIGFGLTQTGYLACKMR